MGGRALLLLLLLLLLAAACIAARQALICSSVLLGLALKVARSKGEEGPCNQLLLAKDP
jgi:hypothetical protein